MKYLTLIALFLAVISLVASQAQFNANGIPAGGQTRTTDGTLSFSVRTVTYHGQYAPRNSGVIWITNAQNQFVKTIKIWAATYRWTLIRWNASSGGNTTGAVTGASLNNHILHNVSWNGANYQGTQMPDGEYKINVEFSEHNATAANMGKYKQISFIKGPDPIDQTIPNETYFRDMTLVWQPAIVNGTLLGTVTNGSGNPISGATIQTGTYAATTTATGGYELSLPPGSWDLTCSAAGYAPQSVSGVVVESANVTEQNFVLSAVANGDELNPQARFQLLSVSPNPFRTSGRIVFSKESSQPVALSIGNLRGQIVLERSLGEGLTGRYEFLWDGCDGSGKRCPAGTYILKLRLGKQVRAQKLQLL